MMFIDLLLLTSIIVFAIDLSGFVSEIETNLSKWLKVNRVSIPRPISCSLCMSWWCGIAYILATGNFSLIGLFWVAMCAYLTTTIYKALQAIKDTLEWLIDKVYRTINR